MISFEKIIVEDFMSIEYLEFDFTLGVNAFVGETEQVKLKPLLLCYKDFTIKTLNRRMILSMKLTIK